MFTEWAATAASYCSSRAGELPKQNMTKSHKRWDGKLCNTISRYLHSLNRLKSVHDVRRLEWRANATAAAAVVAAAQFAKLIVVAPTVDGARGGAREVELVAGARGPAAADVRDPVPDAGREGGHRMMMVEERGFRVVTVAFESGIPRQSGGSRSEKGSLVTVQFVFSFIGVLLAFFSRLINATF